MGHVVGMWCILLNNARVGCSQPEVQQEPVAANSCPYAALASVHCCSAAAYCSAAAATSSSLREPCSPIPRVLWSAIIVSLLALMLARIVLVNSSLLKFCKLSEPCLCNCIHFKTKNNKKMSNKKNKTGINRSLVQKTEKKDPSINLKQKFVG